MGDAIYEQQARPTGQACPTAGQHRTQQVADRARSLHPGPSRTWTQTGSKYESAAA